SGSIGFVSGIATIPSTGTYLITFEMAFDSTTAAFGVYNQMYIKKNGSDRYGQTLSQVSGSVMYLSSSCQLRLITNDTIELYVYQNTSSNLHCGSLADGIARIQITKLF